MRPLLAALALIVPVSGAAQDPESVIELRALARDGPDSVLVERVRRHPDDARRAVHQLLAAGPGSDSAALAVRTEAERLANAYALAWRDSFPLRQVRRFGSLSAADRHATVAADSVRKAGDNALKSAGIEDAMRAWRESLRRFEAVADTAGIATAFGSIGSGFFLRQELDSAEVYLARSLDLAKRIGNNFTAGQAMAELGNVSDLRGDLEHASELYRHAGELLKRIGDTRGHARVQNGLGIIAARQGDLAGARRAFEAALSGLRAGGYPEETPNALLNLAHLAKIEGGYAEAAGHLREALSILRSRDNHLYAAATLKELGALLVDRGDYRGALRALSEAAGILRRIGSGPEMDEIEVRVLLAHVRANMGDLQATHSEVARAESLASRLRGGRASVAMLAGERGNLALEFNRLPEAERQYARAERLTANEDVRQMAQYGMAKVFLKRESYRRAQAVLERLLEAPLTRQQAAETRLMIGEVASKRGDTASARRAFSQALDSLQAMGAVVAEAQALGMLGNLEAGAGRALVAESLYQRGLTRLGVRPAPGTAWLLHADMAASLRSRGALPEAARELQAGIAEIERVSGGLALEEHRSAFLADKWDVYVELALLERARGRTEAAFEASERLRARQMLDLLARGRVGEGQAVPTLVSREQDLRRRMADLTRQLAGSGREQLGMRDAPASEEAAIPAREELARTQEEYGRLLLELRETNPSYAALIRGEITRARAVMAALGPEEALLEYLVGDSTTLVFVVTADTVAALDLKLAHEALTAQVDFARSALASVSHEGGQRTWRPPVRRLYQRLIGPVEGSGLLAGKRRLIIAPHAELHYLPFSALVRPGPPEQLLIEQYLIEYVPSASVWLRLRDRPGRTRGGGILALAPQARALPGSQAEVAAIGDIYGERAHTLIGAEATERAFRDLAPKQEIVHLATYGVLNKHNPLFSFVEMNAGGEEDGRLEVHEVFGLTLNARLLVLSACQTGLAAGELTDVPPGDDWVGLVQGFLYAGASNVLATLWPVADVATARLMKRFYTELAAGRPEPEALALAQRAAAHDPAMAHPFFWAGFALIRGQ